MDKLLSLYIACTIFGVGVTMIDMLGILGDLFHGGDHGTGGLDHGSHGGAHLDQGGAHGDLAAAHGEHGGGHGEAAAGHGDHAVAHHADQTGGEHGAKGSLVAQENYRERHLLASLLSLVRSLVHFALGFGPVGWFALATGRGMASSLAWSLPVGLAAMIGGRLLRRMQSSELDSQMNETDLIMGRGEVLVSIGAGQIGKVRIQLEDASADRFARAKDPQQTLRLGTKIRVVEVSEEYVYVEEDA